jgi:hypothetical protein
MLEISHAVSEFWPPNNVILGYLFSLLGGHLATQATVNLMYKKLPGSPDERVPWMPPIIGFLERILYTAAWVANKEPFVAVWLAFKGVAQWTGWNEGREVGQGADKKKIPGRAIFNIFLIGNALSLLFAVTGGEIVNLLPNNKILASRMVLGVCAATLLQYWYIRRSPKWEPPVVKAAEESRRVPKQ